MTVACQRPSEDVADSSCDCWADDDWHQEAVSFQGDVTLYCSIRKQDQECKGYHMRFGCFVDPALDMVYQMGLFMDLAGTRPRAGCTKRTRPHALCPVCHPLFPKFQNGTGRALTLQRNPCPLPPSPVRCLPMPCLKQHQHHRFLWHLGIHEWPHRRN